MAGGEDAEEVHAMQVTAVLTHAEEGGYVALNPETGTTTQGETIEQALAALADAVGLYLEGEAISLPAAPLVTMVTVPDHA